MPSAVSTLGSGRSFEDWIAATSFSALTVAKPSRPATWSTVSE